MDESTILEVLKSIVNRLDTVAALTIATFMLVAAALAYLIMSYYK